MPDQLELLSSRPPVRQSMGKDAVLLRGAARPFEQSLLANLETVTAISPFRNMVTPGGKRMSVAMTNCGGAGWVTDSTGYRYDAIDPETRSRWPALPKCFSELAIAAAAEAGFPEFRPDACLINCYLPGTRLSLHQDRNERNFSQPIVSVSLGLPATFLFGGLERRDPTQRYALEHGDVAVWGGASRLRYHGIAPLRDGSHTTLGRKRINLTFRCAL
jgi:alkylated DNA repair protein (DNA oxidative demethylase)